MTGPPPIVQALDSFTQCESALLCTARGLGARWASQTAYAMMQLAVRSGNGVMNGKKIGNMATLIPSKPGMRD